MKTKLRSLEMFKLAVTKSIFGLGVALLCLTMAVTVPAQSKVGPINDPNNEPPPAGAILDLNSTPIIHTGYTLYTVDFTASQASTNISFALREDPAFLLLDDVSVMDLTHPSGNLILNGGFELGPVGASAPTNWTYLNTFGASFGGVVASDPSQAHSGNNFYYDGAVQAYDGITQGISATVGDTYEISFWLTDNSALTTYSRVSTNGDNADTGGNGADLLVYAGAVPTVSTVPDGGTTIVLFGLGLISLGITGLVGKRSERLQHLSSRIARS